MNEPTSERHRGWRIDALLKLLFCLVGYLAVISGVYWAMTHAQLSARAGAGFTLMFTFTLLLLSWAINFKPYRP